MARRVKSKEEKENYVQPAVFKEQIKQYYETDEMTNELACNLNKIASGLSYSPNFINYTKGWKDDMVGDALVKMYAALKYKKYKFKKETNPFSYFTTIAWNAFINRIKKEQKHHKAVKAYKEQVYENIMTDPELSDGHIYVRPNNEFELEDNE